MIEFFIFMLFFTFCCSLNNEGIALLRFKEKIVSDPHGALFDWIDEAGVETPCSWNGVKCSSAGHVIVLDLKDLGMEGTVAADIGELIHMKSLTLCNNSFSGVIPDEIENLGALELLDLRHNNFSGRFSCRRLGNNFSSKIILMDKCELSCCTTPDVIRDSKETRYFSRRMMLVPPRPYSAVPPKPNSTSSHPPNRTSSHSPSPSPSPARSPASGATFNNSANVPPNISNRSSSLSHSLIMIAAIAVPPLFAIIVLVIFVVRYGKASAVNPWIRGLSGQLQKETAPPGVPKIKRSELEAACEDFSNVIGSFSGFRLYKGTLISGVEVAVAPIAVESAKNWSSFSQSRFWKKIEMLSRVKHKNFISLLGYCEEESPFTRMLVFEYAPNGTLFEHLHNSTVREAEPLDWQMRLRIAMGVAFCLDHMHSLQPPLPHLNVTSSAVYLSEDYAAKVSDFISRDRVDGQPDLAEDVYAFGVLLFEMISGRKSSPAEDFLQDWAAERRRNVDPSLRRYNEDQVGKIVEVMKTCVGKHRRPSMTEVCLRLREITGISPDGAIPRCSPMWLAELDISG